MFIELTRLNEKKITINIKDICYFETYTGTFGGSTRLYLTNHKEVDVKEPYGYLQEKVIKYQRII